MSRPTSIKEMADTLRTDNLRAKSDVWNLKSLYSQLSPRWHWEIDQILRRKSSDIKHYWHIESTLANDYRIMKDLISHYPKKTSEKIKKSFSNVLPFYSWVVLDMFYDLAVYQKNAEISERVFQELLTHIHSSSDIREGFNNVYMHDINHMVCWFFSTIEPWIKKDQFLSIWRTTYWTWLPKEIIFKLYWSAKHLQESECRAIFRQTYIDYCRKHNIEAVLTRSG